MSNIEKYVMIPYDKYKKTKEPNVLKNQLFKEPNLAKEETFQPVGHSEEQVAPPPGVPEKTTVRWLTLPMTTQN
jgi:hypothetical protein